MDSRSVPDSEFLGLVLPRVTEDAGYSIGSVCEPVCVTDMSATPLMVDVNHRCGVVDPHQNMMTTEEQEEPPQCQKNHQEPYVIYVGALDILAPATLSRSGPCVFHPSLTDSYLL